ncbi:LSm family protein [Natrinema salinisoli]|uniref:LSm family protein n=1 Tax=Natrinema salinisoli TaxID=2878535 RepID=UPI001CF022E1|nr:LSm family protein [Natrinema salinisoli]
MSNGYEKPFNLLKEYVGNTVEVVRHDGSVVNGTLQAFDRHVNMVLTDAIVYSNATDSQHQEDVGRLFQRGGSVTDVRPARGDNQ